MLLSAAISFVVSSIFVKMAGDKDLGEAQEQMANMKAASKGIEVSKSTGDIKKIVFSCDAGMGSSAMELLNLEIELQN